ncbi:hypothetical protein JHW43_009250 [Diplocarpon mali]|nr:hypothetical protein JHW43_009250 [Diplocarpon mali]
MLPGVLYHKSVNEEVTGIMKNYRPRRQLSALQEAARGDRTEAEEAAANARIRLETMNITKAKETLPTIRNQILGPRLLDRYRDLQQENPPKEIRKA